MGGVRTTSGVQPTFWVISRSVEPWRPMTIPGFSASMTTSPVSGWKSRSVTPASSGMTERISSRASPGGVSTDGSGRTVIRLRSWEASWRIRSPFRANFFGSRV
jgi:hypothetical protein